MIAADDLIDLGTEKAHISGIDKIDAHNASCSLSLVPADILDMTDSGWLVFAGDANDSIVSTGIGWQAAGSYTDNGHVFDSYMADVNGQNVYLSVEQGVNAVIS